VVEAARKLNPDYQLIRRGSRAFAPEDAIALCARHRAWLAAALATPFLEKTVVITHFAPHPRSIAPGYVGHRANPGFVVDLGEAMGSAALWIHGHTHTFFDYHAARTGDLQPARLSGRSDRVQARPDRGDLSFPAVPSAAPSNGVPTG